MKRYNGIEEDPDGVYVMYKDYLELLDLICEAAPIPWCSGQFNGHAEAWDKKARYLLRRAMELSGI